MSVYVYSTMSAPTAYAIYEKNDVKAPPVITRSILINGGANVANKDNCLITPRGVVTEVSDEDYKELEKDYHFQEHIKHGYLSIERREMKADAVADDMTAKDLAAPKTPDDPEFSKVELNGSKAKATKGKK